MVSSGLANGLTTTRPKDSVLDLLFDSGLMAGPIHNATKKPIYERLTITSKGFQFLLEERQTQVWQILICYLDSKDVSAIDLVSFCIILVSSCNDIDQIVLQTHNHGVVPTGLQR